MAHQSMQSLIIPSLFLAGVSVSFGCTALLDFGEPIKGAGVDAGNLDCGDGLVQVAEGCDDNNRTALDGCGADCSVEAGYSCGGEPSSCALLPLCPTQSIVSAGTVLESCKSYFDAGYRASGKYLVDVDGAGPRSSFEALCDMVTAGGGWTVVVNNVADAVEPQGCQPRLASVDVFACGTPSCSDDFAVPAYGLSFTDLVWAAHDGALTLGPHNLFRWATPQTLPNLDKWSLTPDESGLHLPGFEAETLIECQSAVGAAGLRGVANVNVRMAAGGFMVTDVITVFDQDANPATNGNMSLTDTASVGLDDFEDGGGCGDFWHPTAHRGSATLIMVR